MSRGGLLLGLVLAVAFPALAAAAGEEGPPAPGGATAGGGPPRTGETTAGERPAPAGAALELIADAWPARPRVLGYEYNQKNHHDPPTLEASGPPPVPIDATPAVTKRRRYRVVGVVVRTGEAFRPAETRLVNRTKGAAGDPFKIKIGPRAEILRFFVVTGDPDRPVRFELLGPFGDEPLATLARAIPSGGRTTANPYDARFVAAELNNEQRVHESYPIFAATLRVMSDVERPIPGARLTLLHDQFGLIETGETDLAGRWQGRLLGGAWTAIAFGAPRDEPGAGETALRTPRAVYLIRSFEVGGRGAGAGTGTSGMDEVVMRADQSARVRAVDSEGRTVPIERLTVTPHKIAEALRFADVHVRCAPAFSLDLEGDVFAGALDLLTNKGASYDLAALVRPADGTFGFLHATAFPGEGDLPLVFAPARMARYIFDPPTGFGGGKEIRGRLTLLEAERQSVEIAAGDLVTLYAPPGAVRVDLAYALSNGDRLTFVPRRIDGKPGGLYDLTPRPPFSLSIFAKISRGTQILLAITDGAGQIVSALESEGRIRAFKGAPPPAGGRERGARQGAGGEALFDLPLKALTFQFPTGFEKIDLKDLSLEARLRIGTEWLRGRPAIEMVRKYAAYGTWANVPRLLEPQADAFLSMVARSCEGEKRFLGGPPAPVGMDFEIFLPPGVGGTGGGGVIQLGIDDLLRFVHETDRLPGAYCHELGHNVGFGHDPYMLLAPAGVEEGMYGPLGYRMMNGAALQALFRYLDGRRHEDQGSWALGTDIFGGLRLLYGADVHRRMFDMQRTAENALRVGGLSSIERIATLYSLATGDNVAWLFRAYGWPVFDFRVAWGRSIALTRGKGVEPLNADVAQAAALRRFFVQGPLAAGAEPPWQAVTWPSDFIALDQDRPPAAAEERYRLFARIVVPQTEVAYLIAASDVALEARVNGHAVARLDASPQLAQPVHDELMLDRKRAFPVLLMGGENAIEIDVLKPPGSKGFLLGFAGTDGRPLAVRQRPEGPDLEAAAGEERKLKPAEPVSNPGFEEGSAWPAGWIAGPVEPAGGVVVAPCGEAPAGGSRCLRLDVLKPATGAVIQRVVVEPGALYRVRARMRTDAKWDGDAYVSLFVGDVNAPLTRTEPQKSIGPRWVEVRGRFAAQKRRVVYVCCYVKAKAGAVFFDDVELVREK